MKCDFYFKLGKTGEKRIISMWQIINIVKYQVIYKQSSCRYLYKKSKE